ncbi:LysR family transcriptional regulator [Ramlibacter sp. USB13]|uniref:LysR family transcriptional regulator n=1 Tax=Ramlibacter cellulosilyticus TaxID=2764187 RepID=A0A923MM68_9BURK|nr:LysR family transcriptional regulator [Ramlibacter cellulosilyticus]MBC5782177.1 LysR family transcriptional regulator [Ramlibacter cellulosilyticus]
MRNLQFDEMALYARVAQLGSLSAVARERDVPVSQVSRTLARLEKACGARLMNRSTHGLSLTEEGRTFLEYSRRALDTMEELEGAFAERTGEPSGVVRVAASTVVAHYPLVPSLEGLARRHPRLQVEIEAGDRIIDMAREGIDIAIRAAGSLPDTVVARQIGTLGRSLYASPAYAQAHGLPRHPEELARHTLVSNSAVTVLNEWPFLVDGKPWTYPAQGKWRANDTNMAAAMVLQGLGIGRLATLVGDVLAAQGALVRVLPEFVDLRPVPVYAVTGGTRHRLPKIRACLEYWTEWFGRG